jgi:hypothetical protein
VGLVLIAFFDISATGIAKMSKNAKEWSSTGDWLGRTEVAVAAGGVVEEAEVRAGCRRGRK